MIQAALTNQGWYFENFIIRQIESIAWVWWIDHDFDWRLDTFWPLAQK